MFISVMMTLPLAIGSGSKLQVKQLANFFIALSSYLSSRSTVRYFENNKAGDVAWILFVVTSISRIAVASLLYLDEEFLGYRVADGIFPVATGLFITLVSLYLNRRLHALIHIIPSTVLLMAAFFRQAYIAMTSFGGEQINPYFFIAGGASQLGYFLLFIPGFLVAPAYLLEVFNIGVWTLLYTAWNSHLNEAVII